MSAYTILIVDDEANLRLTLSAVLQRQTTVTDCRPCAGCAGQPRRRPA